MISLACNNNVTVHQIVNEILDEEINKGNMEAKAVLNRITEFINQSLELVSEDTY